MMRALLPFVLLAIPSVGQWTATVPNVPSPQNVDRPWAGGIGRYQQWWSAPSLQATIPEPARLERLECFAGSSLTSTTTTIDCEILLAHGLASGVTGVFGNNYSTPPVVVLPRQNITLAAGATGAVVLNVPFSTLFTWDRVRPLLLEVRIYGNGLGNQPFLYNFRGVTASIGATTRVYQAGSTGATSGLVQPGVGLIARFTARPGVLLDYGTGCAGGGGVVPKNRIQQVMSPGIGWTHYLENAASQSIALWIMGPSDAAWETIPLPVDLSLLFGYPSPGCMLRTNPVWIGAYVTVGGGPGSGLASFTWQLPGVTSYVGLSFYTQWIVFDSFAPNGVLSTTQGIRAICAPVGG